MDLFSQRKFDDLLESIVTPVSYGSLFAQLSKDNIAKLEIAVNCLFKKASSTDEPTVVETCAKLCKEMSSITLSEKDNAGQVSPFIRCLQNTCRRRFSADETTMKNKSKTSFRSQLRSTEESLQYEKRKLVMFGNTNLIEELYKIQVIDGSLIQEHCINRLLNKMSVDKKPCAEHVACLVKLFTIAGQNIETTSAEHEVLTKMLNDSFNIFEELVKYFDQHSFYKIKAMIQGVKELRANGWMPISGQTVLNSRLDESLFDVIIDSESDTDESDLECYDTFEENEIEVKEGRIIISPSVLSNDLKAKFSNRLTRTKILTLDEETMEGTLNIINDTGDNQKFQFRNIVNSTNAVVEIRTETEVYFHKDSDNNIFIVIGGLAKFEGSTQPFDYDVEDSFIAGKVILKEDKQRFLKSTSNQNFVFSPLKNNKSHKSNELRLTSDMIKSVRHLLPIKAGDELLMSKSSSKYSKKIYDIDIARYRKYRTYIEITRYFEIFAEDTESESSFKVLQCKPLWHFLSNLNTDRNEYIIKLIEFFFRIFKRCNTTKPKTILEMIIHGDVFKRIDTQQLQHQPDTFTVLTDFSDMIFRLLPNSIGLLSISINGLSGISCNTKGLCQYLIKLSDNLFKKCNDSDVSRSNEIMTKAEVHGIPLHKDNIRPVTLGKPYSNIEEYKMTYFKLLKAECFTSIQKGIQNLIKGNLDTRDMHVYRSIIMNGYKISGYKTELCLRFIPEKTIRNWATTGQLMYGNLVCISMDETFQRIVWATVSTRDVDHLNRYQEIFVEVIDTDQCLIEAIQSLNIQPRGIGSAIMVESPNYYQSFRAALKSFDSLNLESYYIKNCIIYGLKEKTDAHYRSDISLSKFGKDVIGPLESSQKDAFLYAIRNRLAIIQGPPGTGKTYVGAKLIEYLVQFMHDSPILILTYKNHALDELIKHILKFISHDYVARLGGQSKDEEIKKCLLSQHSKGHRFYHGSSREPKEEIKDVANGSLKERFSHVLKSQFSEEMFLDCSWMKGDRLCSFLVSYIKHRCPKHYQQQNELIVQQSLQRLFCNNWDHVLECLQDHDHINIRNNNECRIQFMEFKRLFSRAFESWLPNKKILLDYKRLEQTFSGNGEFTTANNFVSNEEEDDYDTEMRQRRVQATGDSSGMNKKIHEKDHLFRQTSMKTDNLSLRDFPSNIHTNCKILQRNNLWTMKDAEKLQFIYTLLKSSYDKTISTIDNDLNMVSDWQSEVISIEESNKLQILKNMKVVCATITGASMQASLIQKLRPEIVLIEEAAEILEPSLLSCLNEDVKHIIMIGDHKQLRPLLDVYELRREYNFHISMMERLIKLNYPYKTLQKQGRMRPEISALLTDIYPRIQNFEGLDKTREPLNFLTKTMFFWTHSNPETEGRSPSNSQETFMVVSFVMSIIASGYKPEQITILATYLGQVRELRKLHKKLMDDNKCPVTLQNIDIRTIDEYQGDENDFVIISLVRSNKEKKIGYVSEIQRRCVAQSRAKCGLFFIGDVTMYQSCKNWSDMIQKLKEQDCIGTHIDILCPEHRHTMATVKQDKPITFNTNNDYDKNDLMFYVINGAKLCDVDCDMLFSCGLEEHRCKKTCRPYHLHDKCRSKVSFVHEKCGHSDIKDCWIDKRNINCKEKIAKTFPECNHTADILCFKLSEATCPLPCERIMECSFKHKCNKLCGHVNDNLFLNSHKIVYCNEVVTYIYPDCGHITEKTCSKIAKRCSVTVPWICSINKSHKDISFRCGERDSFTCPVEVNSFSLNCGHVLQLEKGRTKKCGDSIENFKCSVLVRFSFPECGHKSGVNQKKKCGEPLIRHKCNVNIDFRGACGHPLQRKCYQRKEDIDCLLPCEKILECNHPCQMDCCQPCQLEKCRSCEELRSKKLKEFKIAAKARIENIILETPALLPLEDASMEYSAIAGKAKMYTNNQQHHETEICGVIKIINPRAEKGFEQAKLQGHGDTTEMLFQLIEGGKISDSLKSNMLSNTGNDHHLINKMSFFSFVKSYCSDHDVNSVSDFNSEKDKEFFFGSTIPNVPPGMYYVLCCDVFLGKIKSYNNLIVSSGDNVKPKDIFDSTFSQMNIEGSSEVRNTTLNIYGVPNGTQILPKYLVTIKLVKQDVSSNTMVMDLKPSALTSERFAMIECGPSDRNITSNKFRPYILEAEAFFSRHFRNEKLRIKYKDYISQQENYKVSKITIIVNKGLEKRYKRKKADFISKGIPVNEILAFHATKEENIKSIVRHNLDTKCTRLHGHRYGWGSYFSELPFFSLNYGKSLLIFRILPGREYSSDVEGEDFPKDYDSRTIRGMEVGQDKFGEQLLIRDNEQFLPIYIIHCE